MRSERCRTALFDVDGTLIDTNYLHTVSWWQAFAQAGHVIPMARIHRAIGMGSGQLLDELLPSGRDRAADGGLTAAHDALAATCWSRLQPLPGAADLLRACKSRGMRVVLASSASGRELEVLRAALGADDVIDAATSAADVQRTKCLFLNLSGAVRRPARSRQDWSCDPDCRADIGIALRVWCGGCLVRRLPGLLRLAAISPAHP